MIQDPSFARLSNSVCLAAISIFITSVMNSYETVSWSKKVNQKYK